MSFSFYSATGRRVLPLPSTTNTKTAVSGWGPGLVCSGIKYDDDTITFSNTSGALKTTLAQGDSKEDSDDLSQLPELRARIRRHVKFVLESMPPEETAAYFQALSKDAALVLEESDPLIFVRACQYNVFAGVKRLCCYWTERLKLFGPERAFLPLTLTGTGALTHQDLLSLRAGFPALLPDASTGHKCVLFDRRNKVPHATPEGMLRCMFYAFKVLAESDLSQVERVIVLAVAVTPRCKNSDMDWGFANRVADFISNAFPVRTQFHLLSTPQQRKPALGKNIVDRMVNIVRNYFPLTSTITSTTCSNEQHDDYDKHSTPVTKVHVHVQTPGGDNTSICDDLMALGLTKKSIPHFYGGKWKQSDFFDWCEERMEWEHQAYKHRLMDDTIGPSWKRITTKVTKDALSLPEVVSSAPYFSSCAPVSKSSQSLSTSASECGPLRWPSLSQRLGGSHGVDDRQREEEEQQQEENVKEAKEVVRREQRRITDLIRSRQKRERASIAFQELQEESLELERQNKRLKAEHARLTRLWADAEQSVKEWPFCSQQE
ncbi:hypothetical protein ACA910_002161 [Epithemia clementina (nom. ined.)]